MKLIVTSLLLDFLFVFTASARWCAMTDSTLSCLHLYLPPVSDVLHELRMCFRLAGLSHSLQFGVSVMFQRQRLLGEGSRS